MEDVHSFNPRYGVELVRIGEAGVLHSFTKVQFYCIDQWYEPRQERLMRWMSNIRVERCFVLEQHYAAKRIAFASRRNILAHMGLKKSRDEPLESGNLF